MTAIDVCISCSSSSHIEFVPFSLHLAQSQQDEANTDGMYTIAIQDTSKKKENLSQMQRQFSTLTPIIESSAASF
jgi:hypothetical protein